VQDPVETAASARAYKEARSIKAAREVETKEERRKGGPQGSKNRNKGMYLQGQRPGSQRRGAIKATSNLGEQKKIVGT